MHEPNKESPSQVRRLQSAVLPRKDLAVTRNREHKLSIARHGAGT
jgi:hypothetical protein